MAEAATTEFWKDTKPIPEAFRPGALMWLDEEGKTIGHYDVFDYMAQARAHYEQVGIPADYLDSLIR